MRYFRLLPPLLRVASIVGLLFLLAGFGLLINAIIMNLLSPSFHASWGSSRLDAIAMNLWWLGLACFFAVNSYSTRLRWPDRGSFPLASWQSQVRAIGLLSALPVCGIALALIISPTSLAFLVVVVPICALATVVVLAAHAVGAASTRPVRTRSVG